MYLLVDFPNIFSQKKGTQHGEEIKNILYRLYLCLVE